ncbi:exodeoxyribonuclease V subunit alpha [Desulfatitalea alkaliphila]|uniref:Exodeoxyribonuclease V subunit alpha n=1 Tax=Desulfatitalea alkaliphila TaxID=2929485 RepID=A0AA41R192_9BACT|nr:exodeoxyribonuclease V subunit alpha [Desulfatitalea alkaliphila]MCJ8500554.1 exodeoxyribonuclease V subunit alpha [Desulfatitalea alkaliphila]
MHDPYLLRAAHEQPLRAIDRVFAKTVQRLGGCADPWVGLAAALVSRAAGQGHVCLDLDLAHAAALSAFPRWEGAAAPDSPRRWRERLQACAAVGQGGAFRPLIMEGARLYLQRYWAYEHTLARAIRERCRAPAAVSETTQSVATAAIFSDDDGGQRRAAQVAATRRFSVISGGPGTGKTYTVARIIQLLHHLQPDRSLTIHLAAPTGKAAARLQGAVQDLLAGAGDPGAGDALRLHEARTLHRLLGFMPARGRYRYNADNPLPSDAVIVDEASMIDLALMVRLMEALAPHTRLVLVGDKDQLASVEAGAVLGDICYGLDPQSNRAATDRGRDADNAGQETSASLADHIVVLDRTYRFEAGGGIAALSRAINAGQADAVRALLADEGRTGIRLTPLTDRERLAAALEASVLEGFAPLFEAPTPGMALTGLNRFKILCAVRQGPFGVEALNTYVTGLLRSHGRIPPAASVHSSWYPGRPVMVRRNDYYQGLFNGDAGVAMHDPEGGPDALRVVFAEGREAFRSLAPHQLPDHETVYAMTVHKSQGSEFDHVVLVLPDQDSPLLTRELVYTAVTRARKSLHILAPPPLLDLAVGRRIQRSSGLREALWAHQSRP